MNLYYISDLHISGADDKVGKILCNFLKKIESPDVLVLGGDIFDLFVGNKRLFKTKHANLLGDIRACAGRGVTIYYLEGNHDFHMQNVFEGAARINVRTDAFGLELMGKKIWVAHGDRIDPDDTGYHFLRWITRTGPIKWLIDIFPDSWLEGVGAWMSKTSRSYNNSSTISEERKKRLNDLYFNYAKAMIGGGQDFVLVGHSHIPAKLTLTEGARQGEYLNLGFSGEKLLVGVLAEGKNSFELQEIEQA